LINIIVQKNSAFFVKFNLYSKTNKNINQRNIPRLHQRPFAIFRITQIIAEAFSSNFLQMKREVNGKSNMPFVIVIMNTTDF